VLYRIAQEALSNVARHAHASRAEIELAIDDRSIRLTVRDDGCGFNPVERRSSRESGLGLLGMEERVQALQGQLTIDSRAGEGTAVRVELPRHAAA
jgi:signal transduction histidine kinase